MHRLGTATINHSNPGTPGSYFKQYLAEAPCFPAKSRPPPPPLPGIQLTGALLKTVCFVFSNQGNFNPYVEK